MRPIDADALAEKILDVVRCVIPESEFTEGYTSGLYATVEQIKKEPTIEQPKWIPVTERLPDCEWGAECPEPVFYKMKRTGTVYAGYYGTGSVWRDKYFRQYTEKRGSVHVNDVACWMYQSALPQPPKGDE